MFTCTETANNVYSNQETEGSQDRLTVHDTFFFFTRPRSHFGRRAVHQRGYGLRLLIFKMGNNKVDLGQIAAKKSFTVDS